MQSLHLYELLVACLLLLATVIAFLCVLSMHRKIEEERDKKLYNFKQVHTSKWSEDSFLIKDTN